jgi:DNA-binding NtrC family response regulator
VLEAANPNVAVEVAAQEVGPIDLLLTDVVMPGESGPELFDRLTLIRPEMRVCYMSGYTDQATVRRGVLPPSAPFLQKPFTASALLGKAREALDAPLKGRA